jgi:diguanylate cyclase (GGDEF)-like protein
VPALSLSAFQLADVALLVIGAILGALAFSLVVGRRRARSLARLADRLARASGGPDDAALDDVPAGPSAYPDRVLNDSVERLAGRIAEVEALASTDPLTRLTNRLAVLQLLEAEIDRSNRYARPLAIALIDIDHFKWVNDTHGHAVGDEVLRHVAGVLRANIRSVDTIGRYGGEEFLLVMPETDIDGALASAENLRRVVGRADVPLPGSTIRVAISVGVAGGSGRTSLEVDRLLRDADNALYSAKGLGRDQVQAFRPVDEGGTLARATIDSAARARAAQIGRDAFAASKEGLLEALAQRPGWAGGASQLIARLAADIGRAVGLPDADIDRIHTASLLHDLGKLAIPDEILSKPAPLTPDEWRSIVEHPRIGQVVLEQAGAIRDAAAIVLHHHEWFNGSGYPHGLAGAEIPIGSRIVAIADAYEAMISERPYKRAMDHHEAIAELRRQSGVQFDPELVEVFVTLVGPGLDGVPQPAHDHTGESSGLHHPAASGDPTGAGFGHAIPATKGARLQGRLARKR